VAFVACELNENILLASSISVLSQLQALSWVRSRSSSGSEKFAPKIIKNLSSTMSLISSSIYSKVELKLMGLFHYVSHTFLFYLSLNCSSPSETNFSPDAGVLPLGKNN
jgi:hypothetical protein